MYVLLLVCLFLLAAYFIIGFATLYLALVVLIAVIAGVARLIAHLVSK